jgi:hypothetical protein
VLNKRNNEMCENRCRVGQSVYRVPCITLRHAEESFLPIVDNLAVVLYSID